MRYPTILSSLALISYSRASQPHYTHSQLAGICNVADNNNVLSFGQKTFGLDHESCTHSRVDVQNTPVYHPWTHKPRCTPKNGLNETYCVYTNSNFADGRGISFLTSPLVAKEIINLPAFTNPEIPENVNTFTDPPWEVRNIPGRGNGLFATRTLYRGEEILAATPVGVYMSDAFPVDYGLGYQYLNTAYKQLPKATREKVMMMAAHNAGDPIMERVNTNSFSGEFGGEPHFIVYPETARMNHDCRPNAMYYYDPATLIHSTHASRTILPGEEITITYINILQPRADRQEVLEMTWHFQCTCPLCTSSDEEVAISDARMQRIHEIHATLADWSPNTMATPELAEELITLYELEKLHAAVATGHMFASMAYNAIGDTDRAKQFAERALKAGMVNSGVNGGNSDVDDMRAMLRDAESHWSYLARPRKP
ncbi:hypothetical protein BP5796_08788 [Coleophoma crateriformis]|uniref:SET domain-containing protein n=1 Tax=Coleophoma crateriformis TaxID=565419 RepID=A0A3D8R928_9HELO|nr:hypothetical protein BP5796_08788 [Coleophoma crateriformis]